jgi:D-alanyl-D-alanine dipeptidase
VNHPITRALLWAPPLLWACFSALAAQPPKGFREIADGPAIHLDLKYATLENFTGQNVYGDFRSCFLQETAAKMIGRAAEITSRDHPGWKLRIYDCLRPRSVQRKLWEVVKGTSKQPYVANPETGSIHNYGFAVDLTLEDERGEVLDMGTSFDDFSPLSEPQREERFLKEKKLSNRQLQNRKLLRATMIEAGFIQLPLEWWHYDALPKKEVRRKHSIIEEVRIKP